MSNRKRKIINTKENKLNESDLDLSVIMKSKQKDLKLKNPLVTASGTCGNGKELADFFDINQLGAFTTKGITVKAQSGNKTPRIAETSAGIINSIGLENPGVDSFIAEILFKVLTMSVGATVGLADRKMCI